jgi:GxxExxY protein
MEILNDKFDELSKKIIGAAIEVHKLLGPGFIESIYHNALKRELMLQNISYETEKVIRIQYKDGDIGIHKLDLVVDDAIVVELKAVQEISVVHKAQVISYLKASNLKIGLILNFSNIKIDIRRLTFK